MDSTTFAWKHSGQGFSGQATGPDDTDVYFAEKSGSNLVVELSRPTAGRGGRTQILPTLSSIGARRQSRVPPGNRCKESALQEPESATFVRTVGQTDCGIPKAGRGTEPSPRGIGIV